MHHTSDSMRVKEFLGGFDKNLCYVAWCENTMLGVVIDPSVEPSQVFEFINNEEIILDKILITHTHHDHIKYIDDFLTEFPLVNIYGHSKSLYTFDQERYKGLSHFENINIGKSMVSALHTPGHYADSVCFWAIEENFLFTGDTMFVGRTGRVKSVSSNIKDLYNSVYKIILKLPISTIIFPGHHYGYTKFISIKENIILSNFFRCNNIEEFSKVMEQFEKTKRKN